MGRRPQPVQDRVVSIGDCPLLSYKLSKLWRVHVWQNYKEKTDFDVQLLIGLIPSHKESPNFWHVISQLKATLYWNHIVPDRQGSEAHETPNHRNHRASYRNLVLARAWKPNSSPDWSSIIELLPKWLVKRTHSIRRRTLFFEDFYRW